MMIRSPQHNTKADQENTWSFYVGSKLVEQSVTPESHAALLSLDPTTQQRKLEEMYYTMQAVAASQERPLMSPIGIAFSHEKRENGKIVDEKFLTGKSDEKNEKLSSLI